jgi:hypothetical protein
LPYQIHGSAFPVAWIIDLRAQASYKTYRPAVSYFDLTQDADFADHDGITGYTG